MKSSRVKRMLLASVAGLLLSGTGAASAKDINLTVWHLASDSPALMNLYKAYETYSGNTITFVDMPPAGFETTTMTKWATGERPDVLEWHATDAYMRQLNPEENLIPLTAEAFVAENPELYSSGPVLNGEVYAAMVHYPQVWGFYYNKAIFAEAGITPPGNIEELFAVCDALKEKAPGVTPIFQAGGSGWPPQIILMMYPSDLQVGDAYSKAVMEKTEVVNDPEGPIVQSYNDFVKLRDNGCFNTDASSAKFEDSMAAVFNGTAAMVAQHSDQVNTLDTIAGGDSAKVDETVGFAGWSAGGQTTAIMMSPFGTYYVPKTGNADKEAAALDFIRFITGEGYQAFVEDSGLPPVQAGAEMPSTMRPLIVEVKDAADRGTAPFYSSTIPTGTYDVIVNQLLAGQMEPQQAADQLAVTVEQLSRAQGMPGW